MCAERSRTFCGLSLIGKQRQPRRMIHTGECSQGKHLPGDQLRAAAPQKGHRRHGRTEQIQHQNPLLPKPIGHQPGKKGADAIRKPQCKAHRGRLFERQSELVGNHLLNAGN